MYILQYILEETIPQLSNKEPLHKMVDKLNNLINYIKVLTDKCLSKLNIRYGYQTKLKNDKKRIINLDVTKPHKKSIDKCCLRVEKKIGALQQLH
jgi:hypothetical protein